MYSLLTTNPDISRKLFMFTENFTCARAGLRTLWCTCVHLVTGELLLFSTNEHNSEKSNLVPLTRESEPTGYRFKAHTQLYHQTLICFDTMVQTSVKILYKTVSQVVSCYYFPRTHITISVL